MDSIIKTEHGLLIWLATIVVSTIVTVFYFVARKQPVAHKQAWNTLDSFPMWYETLPSEDHLKSLAKRATAHTKTERTRQLGALTYLYVAVMLVEARRKHIQIVIN